MAFITHFIFMCVYKQSKIVPVEWNKGKRFQLIRIQRVIELPFGLSLFPGFGFQELHPLRSLGLELKLEAQKLARLWTPATSALLSMRCEEKSTPPRMIPLWQKCFWDSV